MVSDASLSPLRGNMGVALFLGVLTLSGCEEPAQPQTLVSPPTPPAASPTVVEAKAVNPSPPAAPASDEPSPPSSVSVPMGNPVAMPGAVAPPYAPGAGGEAPAERPPLESVPTQHNPTPGAGGTHAVGLPPGLPERDAGTVVSAVPEAEGLVQLEQPVLEPASFSHYTQEFSQQEAAFAHSQEAQEIVKSISNAQAWEWMAANIPLFEVSAPKLQEIYYFRWWTYRKHITKQDDYDGFVLTEFNSWTRANSSAFCHQLAEGRWLRDDSLMDDYALFWYRQSTKFHKYSQWSTHALYQRYLVNHDKEFITGLLDELISDYEDWEESHQLPSGLFWSYDVRDAMEESISGSRTEKNVRPTLNSYMAANAWALAAIAKLAGRVDVAAKYQAEFDSLRMRILEQLWDPEASFFKVQFPNGQLSDAREAIGFIPWMFGLPEAEHDQAWLQIRDPEGFLAPMGLTTAERRHPGFRAARPNGGTCEWDGAVWPFATSQTLGALASLLRSPGEHPVDKGDYFRQLVTYAASHERDGLPHIGEYQDEVTGRWLRDDYPRSWHYNHSTFADLIIGGLVGLVPRADDVVEVDPLVPAGELGWFALDGLRYHDRVLTILWDVDGSHYGVGAGLRVYADGQLVAHAPALRRLTGSLPPL